MDFSCAAGFRRAANEWFACCWKLGGGSGGAASTRSCSRAHRAARRSGSLRAGSAAIRSHHSTWRNNAASKIGRFSAASASPWSSHAWHARHPHAEWQSSARRAPAFPCSLQLEWHATVVSGSRLQIPGTCRRHGIARASASRRGRRRARGLGTGPVVPPAYVPRRVEGRAGAGGAEGRGTSLTNVDPRCSGL